MRVLAQVHVRDVGCSAADCASKAVLDRVVAYGTNGLSPALLASTMPPGGISMQQALTEAWASFSEFDAEWLTVVSVEAGPAALVADSASGDELDWVWVVRFVSKNGYTTTEVTIDYIHGSLNGTTSGNLPLP
jgi:hypothetical protein